MTIVNKYNEELKTNAKKLVENGKGILAADESTGTIGKRFSDINVENNLENRISYRKALFNTKCLEKYISGVILFDETVKNSELIKPLIKKNILLGIKVDQGTRPMALNEKLLFTQGLSGLAERCQEYYKIGCRFAKWRAVLKIVNNHICSISINETAYTLSRYAAICQANGLVPIVEPEILMDGDHDLENSRFWTQKVLATVFKALSDQNVLLEGILLKTNMCLPGNENKEKKNFSENAKATMTVLKRTLPVAVPGVTFLSGGQSEEEASLNLNEINKLNKGYWSLSFSFGRALQKSALTAWKGKKENIEKLSKALIARAKANHEAALGKYAGGAEGSTKSLHVDGYAY